MANIYKDLKSLKEMLERGEISQREYEIVKTDLLSDGGETEPGAPADLRPRGRHADPDQSSLQRNSSGEESTASIDEKIERLSRWLDQGSISQPEYDMLKAYIISGETPDIGETDVTPTPTASPTPPDPTQPPGKLEASASVTAALIAGVGIVIGSFLPWASVTTLFGSVSISGTGGDGVITLAIGVIIAIIAGIALSRRQISGVAAILFIIGSGTAGWIAFRIIGDLAADIDFTQTSTLTSIGGGLWLIVISALVGVFAGIGAFAGRTDR